MILIGDPRSIRQCPGHVSTRWEALASANDRCLRARVRPVHLLGGGGAALLCGVSPIVRTTQEAGPPIVMQCNAARETAIVPP
jgi:hypothetical protein